MSFNSKGFSPVHVNAGALSPRIFSYFNPEDVLSEILKPGYFNDKKMIMRPNSFVKVVCKDAIVELVIEKNTGDVTVKNEFLRATDPYTDLIGGTKRRTKAQIARDKKKADSLAKTG
ncbi:MAG: hypothetical protein KAV87_13005 [Desulfobacteraceae bacterium]|nr:hypothetical protein [Desulfobacteraceae bacterium]